VGLLLAMPTMVCAQMEYGVDLILAQMRSSSGLIAEIHPGRSSLL